MISECEIDEIRNWNMKKEMQNNCEKNKKQLENNEDKKKVVKPEN